MQIKDIMPPGSVFNVQNMNVFVMPQDEPEKAPEVVNPGIQYGDDGKAKWSPPLQQQIDATKEITGPSTEDPTVAPDAEEIQQITASDEGQTDTNLERIKELAAVFSPVANQFPAG
jgi:hypothetical protein